MSRASLREQNRLLQDELERCRANCRNHWAGKIVNHLGLICLAIVFGLTVYFSISALAGKTTLTDININASGAVSANTAHKVEAELEASLEKKESIPSFLFPGWVNILSLTLGAGGMLFGFHQARLRRNYIELYAPIQAAFERQFDPGRTSSLLTERGNTRQEDL